MGRTCLVVDDSRVVRKVARRILETHGFQVIEAGDGQQALDACRESMPDCVLLDWNMPVMDGITFLRCLREEFGPDADVETIRLRVQFFHGRVSEALTLDWMQDDAPFDRAVVAGLDAVYPDLSAAARAVIAGNYSYSHMK